MARIDAWAAPPDEVAKDETHMVEVYVRHGDMMVTFHLTAFETERAAEQFTEAARDSRARLAKREAVAT